ncbi:methyl-CpG-binding domain-containing protein 11-like [Canna indica]|uniref:Methyl-CpG-binding domain-containing protein 11-like n=1 Tax=Canna indica TaxID=4628 RepID=A0AAQ3QH06_9LILI|nr:methyl-CpG-binding domain-containing protein 11-like [Canna indica]
MAEEKVGNASAEKGTSPPVTPEKVRDGKAEVVSVELSAPAGWKKKCMLNEDASPRKTEIVFISPSGEEIKNKRQLQQYLKSHLGGPPSSEFDWGTGDTPRRSARIRERAMSLETPTDEKPKKRERKSSSKKAMKDNEDDGEAVDETSAVKDVTTTEEAKETADVEMKEVEDADKGEDSAVVTVTAVNEDVAPEIAANEDTSVKVMTEGAGAKDNPIIKTNGGIEEKPDASLENNDLEAAPTVDKSADTEALPKQLAMGQENPEGRVSSNNRIQKEDPDAAVPKGCPSVNVGDGQHLPKASPVNC